MKLQKSEKFYYRFYELLSKQAITYSFVHKVKRKYEAICPLRESFLIAKTIQTLLITWGWIFAEIILILSFDLCIYHILLASVIGIILYHEVIQWNIHSFEMKLFTQLEQFVSNVRHHYYVSHMIDEAILDAMDETSYQMRAHANQIYEIITSNRCEEMAQEYNARSKNGYLNLFLALCVTVVEYGDRIVHDQSLFLLNLSNLKTEINLEILKLKQMNYLYSGFTFVILSPLVFVKIIEHWSLSNLTELIYFYNGFYGISILIFIVMITLCIYLIVKDLKEYSVYESSTITWLERFLNLSLWRKFAVNYSKRRPNQVARLRRMITESGKSIDMIHLISKKLLFGIGGFILCLCICIYLCISEQTIFNWYELFVSFIIAKLCFVLPDCRLYFHKRIIDLLKEDEIIQYQSIVLMLMYIERMTVLEILERIEEFSNIYRLYLQNCINNFNYSDRSALDNLKCEDSFAPFQRFVDNLMICDEIGIEKAFDEVAAERQFFHEKRKQENEIRLNTRVEIAKFVAYIPAILVIGGYLILPFIIECYRQLNTYAHLMNSFLS